MKDFGRLVVTGDPGALRELVPSIERAITVGSGWHRNHELEKRLQAPEAAGACCFSCTAADGRQAAHLWLDVSRSQARVSNIVPDRAASLGYDDYNRILSSFFEELGNRAIQELGLSSDFSIAERSVRDWVSDEVAELLERFFVSANKATGAAHPEDQRRWYAFVVSAHRERAKLDPRRLTRWLNEEAGFPEDVALDLSRDYESARQLLEYYDRSAAA